MNINQSGICTVFTCGILNICRRGLCSQPAHQEPPDTNRCVFGLCRNFTEASRLRLISEDILTKSGRRVRLRRQNCRFCNNPPTSGKMAHRYRVWTWTLQYVDKGGERSMLLINLYYGIIIWLIKKNLRFASPVVLYSVNTNKRKIHFLIAIFDIWCAKNLR